MKLKSPMSEPEKEQTWDFSIFMQVPAKALTAATTTHTAHIKKTGLRAEALQNLSFIRKLTSHAILTFIPFGLAVFSGRNLHTRAHGGSQGDAL